MKKLVATFLFLTTFGAQALANDPTSPSTDVPENVTVRGFAYAGTGCAANTVRGRFPVEGLEFLITWGGFEASAGANIPLRESRKNCQLNLDLAYPAGWQYTVESTSYQGTVQVAQGTQAIAASYYYFQGSDEQVNFSTLFDSPRRRTYHVTDSVADEDQVWSSCTADRSLNINYQVRVSAVSDGQATGKIAFGVERDGDAAGTLLKLKWRHCE